MVGPLPRGNRDGLGPGNVPDFDSHYVLCITVWELNSGKFQDVQSSTVSHVQGCDEASSSYKFR